MDIKVKINLNNSKQIYHDLGLYRVQAGIDNDVLRFSDPYLPFQTGDLRRSGIQGTDIGSGEVIWRSIKARYLYKGKVMVGRAPKKVTNRNLKFKGEPMRGAFWFERMKLDRKDEIIRNARKKVKN